MIWNAKNGEVTLKDSKMSYVCFGHGKKVLILLPGLSDGLTTVKGKALFLAQPYTLFFDCYTVYMFSRKDNMPFDYTIQKMANDQAEAMKSLGIKKASILGVSQGGMIAQVLAIDYPEFVEKLVLAVTASAVNEMIKTSITQWVNCAKQRDHKGLMIDTAEKSYSLNYLKKYRKLYPVIGLIGKPDNYNRFLTNSQAILNFDVTDLLGRIVCPTLVIGGDADQIVGVQASYTLHSQIKNSELYTYEGLGHAAYEEAKDFNQRVFNFLEAE